MATKTQSNPGWRNIPYIGYFYASLILDIATILGIVIVKVFLPPVSPLLYGRPEGASQLVQSLWLISAPAAALLITLINIFLIKPVKDRFLQQVLVVSSFIVSLLTTITILKIIFLVGFF